MTGGLPGADEAFARAQVAVDSIGVERIRIRGSLQVVLDFAGYEGTLRLLDGIRDEFMIEHRSPRTGDAS